MELYAEDGIHRATWPPMPWFVQVMFRWRYIPLHKGAWRFSSCDQYGYPKELPFVWTFAIFQLSLQFSSCMYTRFTLVPRLHVWTLVSLILPISIIFAADMAFSKLGYDQKLAIRIEGFRHLLNEFCALDWNCIMLRTVIQIRHRSNLWPQEDFLDH